jgi:tRNA(adenine34) deaminase
VTWSASGGRSGANATDAETSEADSHWMDAALRAAAAAGRRGEVPVGAVVVCDGQVVGRAGNASVRLHDPAGHAEVRALRAAGRRVANYRLPGATLYATVEPCAMCMGAAIQARIGRLVYGCADPKSGAAGSVHDLAADRRLNHRMRVTPGVGEAVARDLLQRFFRVRRAR